MLAIGSYKFCLINNEMVALHVNSCDLWGESTSWLPYFQTETNSTSNTVRSRLMIDPTVSEDTGVYVCVISDLTPTIISYAFSLTVENSRLDFSLSLSLSFFSCIFNNFLSYNIPQPLSILSQSKTLNYPMINLVKWSLSTAEFLLAGTMLK